MSDDFLPFCNEVVAKARAAGLRAEVDPGGRSLGKQIKIASADKIPVFGVVGKDEVEGSTLSLKSRTVLTRTSRGLRAQPPACCTDLRRRAACPWAPRTVRTPYVYQLRLYSTYRVPWPHRSRKGGELGSLSVDEAVARMVAAQKASLEPHEVPAAAE